MKNQIKTAVITLALLLNVVFTYAGLDWSYGTLSNADNSVRIPEVTAYTTSGNIFVTGLEQNSAGNALIVTRKFSSAGSLIASVTNSYFTAAGTTVIDDAIDIKTDANDNVYVLGQQYSSSSRGYDVVLIKYNSSLTLQWKKLIYNTNQPNNFNDKPGKIVLDASGNVYVTGTWNNVTITGFTEEIFVQKYSPAGALLYNASVPQAIGKTIQDANDMCIDNSLNVTVCALSKDANNVYSIMYARINNTGSLSWKKFYTPSTAFTFLINPEIECLPSGTIYLATTALRRPSQYDNNVKVSVVKLTVNGTQQWEWLAPELQEHARKIGLRLDAGNNIYAGSDFGDAYGTSFKNHRIYKLNSAGTLQWIYTSAEVSDDFSFETFGSTSLFIGFMNLNPFPNQISTLRKIDCANGSIIWTETISYSPPANYHDCTVHICAIGIQPTTSEITTCSYIHAYSNSTNVQEYRWYIQKYGATSPRLAAKVVEPENTSDENNLTVFPNPVRSILVVQNLKESGELKIMSSLGKTVFQSEVTNSKFELDMSRFENGVYVIQISDSQGITSKKFIIHH